MLGDGDIDDGGLALGDGLGSGPSLADGLSEGEGDGPELMLTYGGGIVGPGLS